MIIQVHLLDFNNIIPLCHRFHLTLGLSHPPAELAYYLKDTGASRILVHPWLTRRASEAVRQLEDGQRCQIMAMTTRPSETIEETSYNWPMVCQRQKSLLN
jgi:hypothetical protein